MSALGKVTIQRTFTPNLLSVGDTTSVKYQLTMENLSQFQNIVQIVMQTFTDDLSALFTVQSLDLVDPWNNTTPMPTFLGGAINFGAGSQNVTQMIPASLSFVFTVQAVTTGVLNTFTSTNVWFADGNPVDLIFDAGSVQVLDVACVAASSSVEFENGLAIAIEQLEAHHPAQLRIADNYVVQIVKMQVPSKAFVSVKNNLGNSILIRRGHPILINNMRVNVEQLIGSRFADNVCLLEPVDTYTVVTKQEDYILINGIWVATWSEASWNNHCQQADLHAVIW